MKVYSLWDLEWGKSFGTFNWTFGASHITSPAYQKRSIKSERYY